MCQTWGLSLSVAFCQTAKPGTFWPWDAGECGVMVCRVWLLLPSKAIFIKPEKQLSGEWLPEFLAFLLTLSTTAKYPETKVVCLWIFKPRIYTDLWELRISIQVETLWTAAWRLLPTVSTQKQDKIKWVTFLLIVVEIYSILLNRELLE